VSVTPSPTVVGVFRDRSLAEQAVDALSNAGFGHEQIQYSAPGTPGNFFEDLKSIFTGTSDNQGNLVDDLTNMGLTDDKAQYYANEYNNGNAILAVRVAGRENEAMSILRQYGAYNIETTPGSFNQASSDVQQAGDSSQQGNYGAPGQYDNVQGLRAQPQSQTVEEHPFAEPQPGNITPEYDAENQTTQPIRSVNETEAQHPQSATVTPEYATPYQDQASQANSMAPAQESASQVVASSMTQNATQPYEAQVAPATPVQETQMPQSQAGVVSPGQTDELQQLQAHLQTLQQQLQQARTQLQAAKEQEGQLRTTRERQQQLQSTRQQIQDLQSQLQATMAELQETQARIAHYQ
jgi:hypothetical protein